jgi:hypothetical protein
MVMRCEATSIFLVAILGVAPALTAERQISTALAPRIGPIFLGLSRSQVEAALGKPQRVVSTGDVLDPEIRYSGLSIWLWERGKVAELRSTNPKFCLAGNICPGASVSTVVSKIGIPQGSSGLQEGTNAYPVAADACWAEIDVKKDQVSEVRVKCQP